MNTIIQAQLFEYLNNSNIRGNTELDILTPDIEMFDEESLLEKEWWKGRLEYAWNTPLYFSYTFSQKQLPSSQDMYEHAREKDKWRKLKKATKISTWSKHH